MQKKFEFQYINSFDFIRGFAVLIVMLLHGSYGYAKGGFLGVDLFFVLSGYLITSLLIKEYKDTSTISLSKFYIRRIIRLLPPLLVCVILSNLLWSFTSLYPAANREIANFGALFYFMNIVKGDVAGNMSHLWSLSVEEHFYLLLPPLFLLCKDHKKLLRSLLIYSFFVVTLLRIFIAVIPPIQNQYFIIEADRFTFCRLDGIQLGALMALTLAGQPLHGDDRKKGSWQVALLLIILLILLFKLSEANPYWRRGGFVLTNGLCLLTIYSAVQYRYNVLLCSTFMRWIGKRSYGIYVYHFPIFLYLENYRLYHSTANFIFILFIRIGITIIVAALSYTFIEQPISKYKRKYEVEKIDRNIAMS